MNKERIESFIRSISGQELSDRPIMEKVVETLDDHDIRYDYLNDEEQQDVVVSYNLGSKKNVFVVISPQSGKLLTKLFFPFRAERSTFASLLEYANKFHKHSAFSHLSVDDDGEISLTSSLVADSPDDFSKKALYIHLMALLVPASEMYVELEELSRGDNPNAKDIDVL